MKIQIFIMNFRLSDPLPHISCLIAQLWHFCSETSDEEEFCREILNLYFLESENCAYKFNTRKKKVL